MDNPTCLLCKAPLRRELTDEPSPEDRLLDDMPLYLASYMCETPGCEMKGRTQPQSDGSILARLQSQHARFSTRRSANRRGERAVDDVPAPEEPSRL